MRESFQQIQNLIIISVRNVRTVFALVLALVLLLCPLFNFAQAAAGDLDLSFGSGGKVTTDISGISDASLAVAIQPDGRIVTGGSVNNGDDFALARYVPNGLLDPSFGSGGIVTTDFGTGSDVIRAMAIQPDGKIVAAGSANFVPGTLDDFALARYNTDGSLDSSFGSGGVVTTDLFGSSDESRAVAIQTDGKIIAAGVNVVTPSNFDFALARYNPDGSLDVSFGVGGRASTDFFGTFERVEDLAVRPDGKIVAAGTVIRTIFTDSADFALARFNGDGSLDATFGAGGKVTTDFFGHGDELQDMAIQADGKIVAVGLVSTSSEGFPFDFGLARYRGEEGSAEFDLCIQAESNGNLLRINSATGAYEFRDCSKGVTLTGTGTIFRGVNNDLCKLELRDSGPDPKRADRSVVASINTCTGQATATIRLGRTAIGGITDGNIFDNTCGCP